MAESVGEEADLVAQPKRTKVRNPKRSFCMVSFLDAPIVGKLPYERITGR
jgi:hypothetical protein